jgi:hypothetical protein
MRCASIKAADFSRAGIAVDGNFFVFDKPVQAANS